MDTTKLIELVDSWEGIARRKFICAETQKDDPMNRPTGKNFITHGAMCYYNCARELREVLASLSPSFQAIDGVDQT